MVRVIVEKLAGEFYDSPVFLEYFGGLKIVVADIETTGLSPAKCGVILGGLVGVSPREEDGGRLIAVQYFADSLADERELLERYVADLGRHDVIVTFNGNGFDIPFLRKRMLALGMDTTRLDGLYSVDMYRWLKKYSVLPKLLPNLKQKTVERYLGDADDRTDEIDGGKSVELYFEYTQSTGARRSELMDIILLHNRDDIVRLAGMMRIIKTLDLHAIMQGEGFPLRLTDVRLNLESVKVGKKSVKIRGSAVADDDGCRMGAYTDYGNGYKLEIGQSDGSLDMTIFCDELSGCTVVDLVRLGLDEGLLTELPGYESGYLILKQDENVACRETNALVKALLNKVLQ